MENITASEIAGLGVGTLLLCATVAAPKVDAFISSAQRSSLGMCKRCGDVKLIACTNCKGSGLVQPDGIFRIISPIDDLFPGRFSSDVKSIPCKNCKAKGQFPCPHCTNASSHSPMS